MQRKRKYSQIEDDNIIDTAVPLLKIRRPFSPSYVPDPMFKLRTKGFVHHHHSNVDTIDQSDDHQVIDKPDDPNLLQDAQNHLALDELGDPNLILDEDQRARSQIKGKVGKNTKIKSSKRPNPDSILDDPDVEMFEAKSEIAASHSSTVADHNHCLIDKFGNPNVIADNDDVEMTDSFDQSSDQLCDEDHEVIDKLGDPSLLLDHMGSPDSAPNDGLDNWFTTNDNGQFEFAFPAEIDTANNHAAIQDTILGDSNDHLANVIQDDIC